MPSKASALSRAGGILTRESAADEINGSKLSCPDGADVAIAFNLRPVSREHAPAERVNLDLPSNWAEAGPLQAEFEPADA